MNDPIVYQSLLMVLCIVAAGAGIVTILAAVRAGIVVARLAGNAIRAAIRADRTSRA